MIKELTRNFEVEFKTSFCKMRNADFGIDDWQISLCRGDGYEIFACTLYIQTASYPAIQTKSMSSKPSFAGVKVTKYLHVPFIQTASYPAMQTKSMSVSFGY